MAESVLHEEILTREAKKREKGLEGEKRVEKWNYFGGCET